MEQTVRKTHHEYVASCTKELYEEYGQIEGLLLMRGIQSMGIHVKDGFRAEDGKVYRHMILVMSPEPIENLHELFPGITQPWKHYEKPNDYDRVAVPAYRVQDKNGKLHIDAEGYSFRI